MAGLGRANFVPLSPLSFLSRAARFFGDRTAVLYGRRRYTYGELSSRVHKLAAALRRAGIGAGDTVAVIAPSTPAMLEAHYAVPWIGAVLNPHNPSLDPGAIGYALDHAGARLVICDREYLDLARRAAHAVELKAPFVVVDDLGDGSTPEPGALDYETFLDSAAVHVELELADESQPLAVLYTSGTTARPKGVVYSHRGAYLAALSNALSFGLGPDAVFLWTWPMFHSNGLSFVWAVTAVGGTHVCLRSIDPTEIFDQIQRHRVSHLCVPPSLMNTLAHHRVEDRPPIEHPVDCITGGAPPASSVIRAMESLGINVTHQYGSTECYGPATVAWFQPEWDQMTTEGRHQAMARQGTPTPAVDDLMVADSALRPVARDGVELGEVMVRSNTVMLGYFGDEQASKEQMAGGWFHTGDIATWHPDGSIEIKDRSVDLIICDGERISSVEVEEVLYGHPDVHEAAVVAQTNAETGEIPCAFIEGVPGKEIDAEELADFCRSRMAEFKVPRRFVFRRLPKTATGKIKKSELRDLASEA